jgi:hypothetical protein
MGKNQDQEKATHDAMNSTITAAVDLERKIQDIRNKVSSSHVRELDNAKRHIHDAIELLKKAS